MAAAQRILITGSSGLIGSEAVVYFDRLGATVTGIDNNLRMAFFGAEGDTSWNLKWLQQVTARFRPLALDIRDRSAILKLFDEGRFDLVIHCAAQPSHDLAARLPFEDWDVNANGTFNLLEAARRFCPDSPFLLMSTNKVYGDAPNELPLVEQPSRFDYQRQEDFLGIDETCRIDRCLHSLFGASKLAADIMAQEYARYFGMPVGIFRAGCVTGSHHSGTELHGFLSYLVKVAVRRQRYTIHGYQGKQVRDNIHSCDVVSALYHFSRNPRPGEVYNLGGGRANSVSILEARQKVEDLLGHPLHTDYNPQPRRGDHICYISNLTKLQTHFPQWELTRSLDSVLEEMVAFEQTRTKCGRDSNSPY